MRLPRDTSFPSWHSFLSWVTSFIPESMRGILLLQSMCHHHLNFPIFTILPLFYKGIKTPLCPSWPLGRTVRGVTSSLNTPFLFTLLLSLPYLILFEVGCQRGALREFRKAFFLFPVTSSSFHIYQRFVTLVLLPFLYPLLILHVCR